MAVAHDPFAPAPPPGQDELPSEDGEPMDTPRHRAQMELLIDCFDEAWNERDDYYVGGNMFVYFSELQSKGEFFRGPDFFVVLETERHRSRKSWVAWQEGGKLPNVVIELLSESTRDVDRGEKKRVYERIWRTGHYVLYDPHTQELEGYALVEGRYVPIVPDARGDLPIASLGLSLGIRVASRRGEGGQWLRFVDRDGAALPSGRERMAAERDAVIGERDALLARVAELERKTCG